MTISRVLSEIALGMTIYLGRLLPGASSTLPEGLQKRAASEVRRPFLPIWACTEEGLPCHLSRDKRGELLPRHFTLTGKPAVYFLWHFPSVARSGRYPVFCPAVPGLSSEKSAVIRHPFSLSNIPNSAKGPAQRCQNQCKDWFCKNEVSLPGYFRVPPDFNSLASLRKLYIFL